MYCSKCGAHIKENDRFCPKCGMQVIKAVIAENKVNSTVGNTKICCPHCGGHDLIIFGDWDMGQAVMSGMAVSVFAGGAAGLLAGAGGLQQKTYWVCKDCGRKFRDLDELSSETSAYAKRAKGFKVFGLIMCSLCLFITIIFLIMGGGILGLFSLLLCLPFVFCMKVSDYQFKSRQEEVAEIKAGMQSFDK